MYIVRSEFLIKCPVCRGTIILAYPSQMDVTVAMKALREQAYQCLTCKSEKGCSIPGHQLACKNHYHMETFEIEFTTDMLRESVISKKNK